MRRAAVVGVRVRAKDGASAAADALEKGMVQNRVARELNPCTTRHACKSRCIKHLMDCIALRTHSFLSVSPSRHDF